MRRITLKFLISGDCHWKSARPQTLRKFPSATAERPLIIRPRTPSNERSGLHLYSEYVCFESLQGLRLSRLTVFADFLSPSPHPGKYSDSKWRDVPTWCNNYDLLS